MVVMSANSAILPARPDDFIEVRDVSVDYHIGGGLFRRGKAFRAVDRVSASIAKGETLGLVGGTGSGKTTVAHVIMGMVTPSEGSVRIGGVDPHALHGLERRIHRQRVQLVMQDPYSSLNPRMPVIDIVAEPLTLAKGALRRSETVERRVYELLSLVGLPRAKAVDYPHQFSGGQRQRIAIARALASSPDIIVLDEPTSALDVSVRAQILMLLKELQKQLGVTYLVISHDLTSVAYLATTVAVMYQGKLVEIGSTRDVYSAPRHPYTKLLLASAPSRDGRFLEAIQPANVNDPAAAAGGGCRYAGRCALRATLGDPVRCRIDDPALRRINAGGQAVACHFDDAKAD